MIIVLQHESCRQSHSQCRTCDEHVMNMCVTPVFFVFAKIASTWTHRDSWGHPLTSSLSRRLTACGKLSWSTGSQWVWHVCAFYKTELLIERAQMPKGNISGPIVSSFAFQEHIQHLGSHETDRSSTLGKNPTHMLKKSMYILGFLCQGQEVHSDDLRQKPGGVGWKSSVSAHDFG